MQKLGNYYNSELNQFIGENLPKIMTSIDLDLFQVKTARKIIRFAEYKHDKESLKNQQEKALKQLAIIAKVINSNSEMFDGWTIQVVLIRGNKPFSKIMVHDFLTSKDFIFDNEKDINTFLTLEKF